MHLISSLTHRVGKAFRHGDIESILEELAKTAGVAAGGSGLLGFASSVFNAAKGGSKFSRMDVKRVYFVRSALYLISSGVVDRVTTGKLVT